MEHGLIGAVTRLIVANDGIGGDHRWRSWAKRVNAMSTRIRHFEAVYAGQSR